MAIERIEQDSRLLMRNEIGENDDGEPIYRVRTLARVYSDSLDEDLWNVANAIAGLQSWPVVEIRRVDNSELLDVV